MNTATFNVSHHIAVALVNGDLTATTEDEDVLLEKFSQDVLEKYGNALFITTNEQSNSDDLSYCEATKQKASCTKLTINY